MCMSPLITTLIWQTFTRRCRLSILSTSTPIFRKLTYLFSERVRSLSGIAWAPSLLSCEDSGMSRANWRSTLECRCEDGIKSFDLPFKLALSCFFLVKNEAKHSSHTCALKNGWKKGKKGRKGRKGRKTWWGPVGKSIHCRLPRKEALVLGNRPG